MQKTTPAAQAVKAMGRPWTALNKTTQFGVITGLLSACNDASEPLVGSDTPTPTAPSATPVTAPIAPQSLFVHVTDTPPAQAADVPLDVLNIIFAQNGSYDVNMLKDGAVIHLGMDADGQAHANAGRADLENLWAENVTLNIHADTQRIEVDHAPETPGHLALGLMSHTGPLKIDGQGTGPDIALELHHIDTLALDHHSAHDATFAGSLDLNDTTQSFSLSTHHQGGDLTLLAPSVATFASAYFIPALRETGALADLTLHANGGDISLAAGRILIGDASPLHSYQVRATDADVQIGSIGLLPGGNLAGHATELESIEVTLSGTATFSSAQLFAIYSDVGSMVLTSTDNNVLGGSANLSFGKVYLDTVAYQEINALDGGNVRLGDHSYVVHNQVFTGSGNIHIDSPTGNAFYTGIGYIQTEAADATDHTGTRYFEDGGGALDIFYGSNKADTISFWGGASIFAPPGTGGIYYDSGGDDTVLITGNEYISIYDGDAGTNDTVMIGMGSFPMLYSRVTFHAGSGEDQILIGAPHPLYMGSADQNLFDFGTYIDGRVDITGLGTPIHKLSFDGLDGITANIVTQVGAGTILPQLDDNRIYLISDGDTAVQGSAIADYENLSDVADFLGALTSQSDPANDHAVFIIHNKTTSSAPGDQADVYFYHFDGDAQASQMTADDLTLLGSATLQALSGASFPLEIVPAQIV